MADLSVQFVNELFEEVFRIAFPVETELLLELQDEAYLGFV